MGDGVGHGGGGGLNRKVGEELAHGAREGYPLVQFKNMT